VAVGHHVGSSNTKTAATVADSSVYGVSLEVSDLLRLPVLPTAVSAAIIIGRYKAIQPVLPLSSALLSCYKRPELAIARFFIATRLAWRSYFR
jgi:hypothetical protein